MTRKLQYTIALFGLGGLIAATAATGFAADRTAKPEGTYKANDPSLWLQQIHRFAQPAHRIARFLTADGSIKRSEVKVELRRLRDKPWEAEGLLYGLAEAAGEAAVPLLVEHFRTSRRPADKVGAALAVSKFGGARALPVLDALRAKKTGDVEVDQWVELLAHEIRGGPMASEMRPVEIDPSNTFDQVIPLQISLTVYANQPDGTIERHVVSPQQLLRVYGQAHACTNFSNRDQRLVISKHLDLNGGNHVEGFLFEGMTFHPDKDVGVVNFLSRMNRDVYRSGQVRDMSMGRATVDTEVDRRARWFAPELGTKPAVELAANPVRLVGGGVTGWLYLSQMQMLDDDDGDGNPLDAGEGQLSSRVTRDASVAANAYFTGFFYGKLSDLDGDGKVDVNTVKALVDRNGYLDLDSDGHSDPDLLTMMR